MRKHGILVLFVLVSATRVADAHVSIASGPAFANKSQKITFGIGHGCDGDDTLKIKVTIPAGISSVRALRSDFGMPVITRDVDNNVTSVEWQKPDAELLDNDEAYYEMTIRARVADAPFTKIYFAVEQTCQSDTGTQTVVNWSALPGETGEPAPSLLVVPQRQPGWNSYTLPAAMLEADVGVFLGDAVIVWKGAAAYSSNPATAAMIAATTGVTALTGDLASGDQLWVKY